jgi:type I restriction enzyme R subunit
MIKVGQIERATQNRLVQLFIRQLGYQFLGHWEEREGNSNLEADLLKSYLTQQGYDTQIINKAVLQFQKAVGNMTHGLYEANRQVYNLLRYGVKVKSEAGENTQTVWLINWEQPEQNHFGIAEEVTIWHNQNSKRPDLVLYVNGIALGVIELKRSTVSVLEGIRQNLDNQKADFIEPFFTTVQLLVAANDTEGLRYGVICTPEKYYLSWKETGSDDTANAAVDKAIDEGIDASVVVASASDTPLLNLDTHIRQMCEKRRFLTLIHDFIVYDRGTKKMCRPHQFFGVQAAQDYLLAGEGGILWHTQGSGKSLTMVWLTRWIRENITDARVLIITDRTELDAQIEKVFQGVNEDIYRTRSGADLLEKLSQKTPWLLCSLIHKFGKREEAGYDEYIEELELSLPADFSPQGNVFVFVDECHRTQSGQLHQAMKKLLPRAVFIGFTGTPLLKKDKQTSLEKFGRYIHTYKFNEAVADKVVLDLRYEARDIEQKLSSTKKIDQWFDAKTRGLTDTARNELKKRWGTMQKMFSSKSRLEKIAADIMLDMEEKDRLQNGRGNALLVAGSIYQACKYYEIFQRNGFKKCAIITSYVPSRQDIKGETTDLDAATEKLEQYEIYQKMLNGRSAEEFEDEVKKKFTDEPAQMKLLIVVDKLLTGFDAPSATYLYIDKSMQDHGLFQAICRVNRLDGEDKEYGYIVDYKDLFKSLEKSITDYTTEAFDEYSKEDVAGLLTDRLDKAQQRLDETLDAVKSLCEPIADIYDSGECLAYFCGPDPQAEQNVRKRQLLYKQVGALVRAFAGIANDLEEIGYSPEQVEHLREEIKNYELIKEEAKIKSSDYIDLKAHEPAMRHLIDTYISAEESRTLSAFDDMTLIDLIVRRGADALDALPKRIRKSKESVAETIENNVRKLIINEQASNPAYYASMSELLDKLVKERKENADRYEEYLAKIIELTQQLKTGTPATDYPAEIDTSARRALYDNLEKDELLALALDQAILNTKKEGWRQNPMKEKEVKHAIKKYITDSEKLEAIFRIVKQQTDY